MAACSCSGSKIQLLFSCILPQKKMWAVQTVNLFVSKIEEGSRHSVWYSSHCGAHPIQCFLEFNIFRGLLLLPTFWPKKCQFVMVSAIQFARPILEHCTGILSDELSLIKLVGIRIPDIYYLPFWIVRLKWRKKCLNSDIRAAFMDTIKSQTFTHRDQSYNTFYTFRLRVHEKMFHRWNVERLVF